VVAPGCPSGTPAPSRGTGSTQSADTWSSYWYNDKIYTNDISRGVDIFTLTDMSLVGEPVRFSQMNPQTQWNLLD
jgi:hypothetical protein